jgi:hypothetical protein
MLLSTTSPGLRDLRALPAVIDLPTAAPFHRLSRPAVYSLAQRGELPFPAHRVGGRWHVRTAELAASLGIEPRWLLADDEPAP